VRFAIACVVPTLVLLSVAATARNVYLAPAMPGFALLVGWWLAQSVRNHDAWDLRAVRITAVLLLLASLVLAGVLAVVSVDSSMGLAASAPLAVVGALGLIAAAVLALLAEAAARRGKMLPGPYFLVLAYCSLLVLPAAAIYRAVDAWQDLPSIGRALGSDSAGAPLLLVAPDETTRAFVDMFARTDAYPVEGPVDDRTTGRLRAALATRPAALVFAQWPGRDVTPTIRRIAHLLGVVIDPALPQGSEPAWASAAGLAVMRIYALPNGRRYALLQRAG